MNKFFSLFLLGTLSLSPLSVFAMTESDEDFDNNNVPIAHKSLSAPNVLEIELSQLDFGEVVKALSKRKLISIQGQEYTILREEPKLRSSLYYGNFVRANPCYTLGLGPHLLKMEDIEKLPQQTKWIYYSFATTDYEGTTYITLRYSADNNPHWRNNFTHPEPFNDPKNHYWHTSHSRDSVIPVRTVNFLLKKVSD